MTKQQYLEFPRSMEDTVENLREIKEIMQKKVVITNLHGKGEKDAEEIELDFGRAIEAVEKQIPKPVCYIDNCGNETASARCPQCYEIISGEYCIYCGQRIKKNNAEEMIEIVKEEATDDQR